MNIDKDQLTAWLNSRHTDYAAWINQLRVEKAKSLLKEHPDWSNEAVARGCGFTDRSYFQRKFKEFTGMTPSQYQA